MKILIAPDLSETLTGGPRYLSINLADLLLNEGHEVSICASSSFGYARAQLFQSPAPLHHLFSAVPHTREETLYSNGALDGFYLKKDLQVIQNALAQSHAQLILEADRPAAIIAARCAHIPVISFLHPGIYRTRSFLSRYLKALNALLREHHLEQILRLSELYDHSTRRIVFGPLSVSPLPLNIQADRFGSPSLPPLDVPSENRICIYLSQNFRGNISAFEKILLEAFQGAGYEVNFWYPGIKHGRQDNIKRLPTERFNLINGARICIHDGDSAVFHTCLSCGTRQLIVNDGQEERSWNASAAERSGTGLSLNLDEISMENLYGKYREILSDDFFLEHAQSVKKEIQQLGSISEIAEMIQLLN